MLQEWIQNIVVFLLLMTMLRHLIPSEKYQKYIQLAMGLILIFMMLSPITKILGMEDKIIQNYIQESLWLDASDAKISGQMFSSTERYNDSYRKILEETIEAYFETQSMKMMYCAIEMNEDMASENYGVVYSLSVVICPKDRMTEKKQTAEVVSVEKIQITASENETVSEISVPEQKIAMWREDLCNQFGIEEEQLTLEFQL